jgi:hypothetical protein
MMMDELERLKGRSVEVVYNDIVYRGRLVGASEEELYLQTQMDWLTLPLMEVQQVRPAD